MKQIEMELLQNMMSFYKTLMYILDDEEKTEKVYQEPHTNEHKLSYYIYLVIEDYQRTQDLYNAYIRLKENVLNML